MVIGFLCLSSISNFPFRFLLDFWGQWWSLPVLGNGLVATVSGFSILCSIAEIWFLHRFIRVYFGGSSTTESVVSSSAHSEMIFGSIPTRVVWRVVSTIVAYGS